MLQKTTKVLIIILVLCGVVFSVLNFALPVYAGGFVGTTTYVDPEWQPYIKEIHHIFGDYYCLFEPSDCAVVY